MLIAYLSLNWCKIIDKGLVLHVCYIHMKHGQCPSFD